MYDIEKGIVTIKKVFGRTKRWCIILLVILLVVIGVTQLEPAAHDSGADNQVAAIAVPTVIPPAEQELAPSIQMDEAVTETERPAVSGKLVALTFDDGPGPYTDKLLDELADRNISATFFVLGSCVEWFPDTVRRMADDGHEIGSHTYSHRTLTKLTSDEVRSEIQKTNDVIFSATGGVVPTLIRPPGGYYSNEIREICAEAGMSLVFWSVDTQDWKNRDKDAILSMAFDSEMYHIKDGSIVIMHDIYETTVEAVTEMIDRLLEDDYSFVTVSELLASQYEQILPGEVYGRT